MTPTQWREEFEREFADKSDGELLMLLTTPDLPRLKSFITSLLLAIKDEVGKEKRGKVADEDKLWAAHYLGYDEALTKVEDLLQRAIDGK